MRRPDSTRWSQTVTVANTDKARLRGFIKQETEYYNAILAGFASLLRTMPEVFGEINQDFYATVAGEGINVKTLTVDTLPASLKPFAEDFKNLNERKLLVFEAVAAPAVLHPKTRRNLALEILKYNITVHESLNASRAGRLSIPVALLSPFEKGVKRHLQLPREAVFLSEDRKSFRTQYNASPIVLPRPIPAELKWSMMILRDDEARNGTWYVEFRLEDSDYLLKFFDPQIKSNTKDEAPQMMKMRTFFER